MDTTSAYFLLGWAVAVTLALILFSGARGPAPPSTVILEDRVDPGVGGCSFTALFIAVGLITFFFWLLTG